MESVLHDPDSEWKTQLQLRLNGPVHRNKGITADEVTRKKNVEKLKGAMYQSYNQQEGLLDLLLNMKLDHYVFRLSPCWRGGGPEPCIQHCVSPGA